MALPGEEAEGALEEEDGEEIIAVTVKNTEAVSSALDTHIVSNISHKYKYKILLVVIQGINSFRDGCKMVTKDCVYELDLELREEARKRKTESDSVLELVYEIVVTGTKPRPAVYLCGVDED